MSDDELREIVSEFRSGLLGEGKSSEGMCFVVALPLSSYLRVCCGVDCELAKSDHTEIDNSPWHEHFWIKLSDGRVLDPTFDQFCENPGEPVYIGQPTEFHAL